MRHNSSGEDHNPFRSQQILHLRLHMGSAILLSDGYLGLFPWG
jgi:hypothetical protein